MLGWGVAICWLSACQPTSASAEAEQPPELVVDSTIVNPSISLSDDTLAYQIKNGVIQLTWDLLANIAFDERYNEEIDQQVPYPIFHPTIQSFAGKEVTIEGFVLPLDETGGDESIVILSAFPYSQCFFCGNAGPESVLDIQMRAGEDQSRFKMDEKTRFVGRLKLNDTDLYYLNYILEDARVL